MKNLNLLCLTTGLAIASMSSLMADNNLTELVKKKEVEVKLQEVFVPEKGFDDNDRVEAVLVGELPNPCYTLDKAYAEKRADGSFYVKQMAWKWNTGACATGDLIEDPVPFATPVLLGQLNRSQYRVEFRPEFLVKNTRSFTVEAAKSDDIDNFEYANMRSISMDEGFFEKQTAYANLQGTLPNQCSEVANVSVELVGNIVIVLPKITNEYSINCEKEPKGFKHRLELPKLKQGHYLLHVRSRGGNAVYQSFRIWEQD